MTRSARSLTQSLALLGVAAAAGSTLTVSPAFPQADCTYEHTYIGNRPKEANPGWHEEAQGIAHDESSWYVTQKNRLWKIPGTHDLASGVACGDVPCRDLEDTELGSLGFDHLGDLEFYQGHLCVGVEFPDKERAAVLALFSATDLALEAYAPLPDLEGTSGWCAVDSAGFAYSSKATVSELSRYEVNWGSLAQGLTVNKVGTVFLLDEAGDPLELFVMQGGVFSDDGLLYLINGDALTDCDGCGIHAFEVTLAGTDRPCSDGPGDCIARQVDHSRNGTPPFDFEYNPGSVYNREEPEGITYWDLTAPGAPAVPGMATGGLPVASSQLHALLLDNDLTSDDDIYVKHYQVAVTCQPRAGIRVSPTSLDFGEVDLGAAATRVVAISNAGNAPLRIGAIEIEGAAPSPFTLGSIPSLPLDLAPAGQAAIEVRFTPVAAAASTAPLAIASDDSDTPVVRVGLAGAGLSLTAQAENLVAHFDEAFAAGQLRGSGPGASAEHRGQALRNMLIEAQSLIEAGRIADACKQLADALARTDGLPRPPDFVTGSAAPEVAAEIAELRSHLGCGG